MKGRKQSKLLTTASSVSEAALEQVDAKPMLKTLRQPEFRWPVVGDGLGGEYQWSAGQWSLLKTLAEMRNLHSKSVLIRLYVSPDDKNSSLYIIKVGNPLTYLFMFPRHQAA